MAKTYDDKCYALAKAFLMDHPKINDEDGIDLLAKQIQVTIDEEIEWMELQLDKHDAWKS